MFKMNSRAHVSEGKWRYVRPEMRLKSLVYTLFEYCTSNINEIAFVSITILEKYTYSVLHIYMYAITIRLLFCVCMS